MKAVVVVSFGSSHQKAVEALDRVEQYIFGNIKSDDNTNLFTAYTSNFIRKKLAAAGIKKNSLDEVLAELSEKNYSDVYVQPTHIIAGQEYERLVAICQNWEGRFDSLEVGKPLIYDSQSLLKLADGLETIFASKTISEDYGILFMGHGTEHISNFVYPALQTVFEINGFQRGFVATVEGWPDIDDAVKLIKRAGYKKIYLAPLLLIAGGHVLNDMIGDEAKSWKNILKAEGFEVDYSTEGLSSYNEILDLYKKM